MRLDEGLSRGARVGPAIVRDERCPARPARVLIVRIGSKLAIEILVLGELVAVQPHAQPGGIGHANRAVLVCQLSAFDDIVFEVVIVGIGGERQVRHHRPQMQHRRELDAELAR